MKYLRAGLSSKFGRNTRGHMELFGPVEGRVFIYQERGGISGGIQVQPVRSLSTGNPIAHIPRKDQTFVRFNDTIFELGPISKSKTVFLNVAEAWTTKSGACAQKYYYLAQHFEMHMHNLEIYAFSKLYTII